ncbi:AbiU2 domain-containing protein [Lutispora saccharofermentans]|uniref:HEPN AbiU2-like domain-containing protein n=1 Tax=Lutispora saccharofermentans TaxID=3024236 RepID=A0ABT1NAN6_9FIRM|nr:hypothetical protein [Lutispora saccharofermentans]MCQ1528308.1 hypothetical protein [Lutispora saccharofermentans]
MANERCNEKLTCLIENCLWIEIYLAIWHKIEEASHLEYLSHYSDLSIAVTKVLVDAAIIALSKIYDTNSSGANISSILRSIDSDKYFIDSEKLTEIKEFAKKQEEELKGEKITKLRDNLKIWRDKFYAHIDKDFLNAENALRREYQISVQEFEQLLEFARYTTEHLYILINGIAIVNLAKTRCEKELDLLAEILGQHRQMYIETYGRLIDEK